MTNKKIPILILGLIALIYMGIAATNKTWNFFDWTAISIGLFVVPICIIIVVAIIITLIKEE